MNSRLFYIFKRKFPPTIASYKAKSLKYLKHLPSKLKSPEQLPGSASLFLPIHRKALNIHYKNINPANEIFEPLSENIQINNDLFVGNLTRKELLAALIPGNPILNKLNDNEQSLAVYLNDVILNEKLSKETRETFTDSLINYLLMELRLNKRPFTLRLRPDFSFSVFDKNVSAKVKFGIQKENTMILIDEDKHIRSLKPSTEYGESQISAEILACAFTNFKNADSPTKGKSQTVYAMRVIGT
ncbi:39190_t:CDS:1, partial [Gigaspora margarita]